MTTRSSRAARRRRGPLTAAEGDGIGGEERSPGRLRQIRERWTLAAQNGLAVAAACGLATIVSPFVPAIFPAKYSFDSTFIQSIAQNVNLRQPDQNYAAAAQFYQFLHLENLPKLTALLTMGLFCVATALAIGRRRLYAASVATLAAIYGSAVLAAVYISPYSKEAPVLLCVVMMLVISRSRTYAAIAMTLFMMLYALEFRLYWVLVAAVFVLQAALLRKGTIKLWRLVAVVALGLAIIAVLIEISHHKSLVEYRAQLNHLREGSSNAVSLISQYVPGSSVFIGYINSIVTLVFVIFPVPLVLLGSPQYVVSAVYIALMTVISVKALKSLSAERDTVLETDEAKAIRPHDAVRCLYVAIAFVIVQSVYVPDYGSALKHISPVLPLVVRALLSADVLRVQRRRVAKASADEERDSTAEVQPAASTDGRGTS